MRWKRFISIKTVLPILLVWEFAEPFERMEYIGEKARQVREAVMNLSGQTLHWVSLIAGLLWLTLFASWPELKQKFPNLRFPKSTHERVHELHHVVMDPETGHSDRIKSVESKLQTDFATVQDVAKRDNEVAIAAFQAARQITAGIDTFLNAPASLFGTLWIAVNSDVNAPGFTYECNCLNVGGMPCTIKKVVIHLDHASFEQNAEDAIIDEQLIKTKPLGKFERCGLIKVPLVSIEKLRQVRFENARLIDDSGTSHYVEVRVSGESLVDRLSTVEMWVGHREPHGGLWRDLVNIRGELHGNYTLMLLDLTQLMAEATGLAEGLLNIRKLAPSGGAALLPFSRDWSIAAPSVIEAEWAASVNAHVIHCRNFCKNYGTVEPAVIDSGFLSQLWNSQASPEQCLSWIQAQWARLLIARRDKVSESA
jgi:hypothetical protein